MVPSDLCVILYAGLLRHFISGAYYPKGGSSEIVYQIIPVIERHGGRVLVDAPVSKILLNESGKIHGNVTIFSPPLTAPFASTEYSQPEQYLNQTILVSFTKCHLELEL